MTNIALVREGIIEAVSYFEAALLDATSRSITARVSNITGRQQDAIFVSKELARAEFLGLIRHTGVSEAENLKVFKPVAPFEPWRVKR